MMKRILISIIIVFSLTFNCFADEGRRMLKEGTYEYQKRDGANYTIYVGEYGSIREPLQNPVIYCPGAIPSEQIVIEIKAKSCR